MRRGRIGAGRAAGLTAGALTASDSPSPSPSAGSPSYRAASTASRTCRCPAERRPRRDPYTVTAELQDVLGLVPHAAVRVNDVAVGRITGIELGEDDWSARVTMEINGDVRLPADATPARSNSPACWARSTSSSSPSPRSGEPVD